MENVRVTAPDLARRAAMEKTRGRLVLAATGFAVLFGALVLKLADATVLQPMLPRPEAQQRRPDPPAGPPGSGLTALASLDVGTPGRHPVRATITDRNGEILAISLPTASVYANPRAIFDPASAAAKLKSVLPGIDEADIRRRLADQSRQFVYIARQITPRQQLRINDLGIPGIDFQPTELRRYPLGRAAAQVLGGVDVDGHGVAGVEKFFDRRLHDDPQPLRLSLDVRVQEVVHDELSKAMDEFRAIGACGIVMDVRTSEVIAMVSLPDYDANDVGHATPDQRFNRAVTGMYEPGSTFKLQTASMALDTGRVHIWNGFDAGHPIHIGRFTITDFEGKHRWLYLPEILAYSSNLGAARMADFIGGAEQRVWMQRMGMLSRMGIELPEAGLPIVPAARHWSEVTTMTVGFGHGIAVSPLHVVNGTSAIADGGVLHRPTLLAHDPDAPPRPGIRLMQVSTSDTVRRLMRLVVTSGYGKPAEVPGYYVGGKTGTAEKAIAHGYAKHANVSAFMSAFPMNAPRYAVYIMLDDPKADASTHGYTTAGWVSAPAAGRVIARIGPMLGVLPDLDHAAAINAALYIPLQPVRPAGVAATGSLPPPGMASPGMALPHPAPPLATAARPIPGSLPRQIAHDYRHEARLLVPDTAAAGLATR